MTWLHLPWDFVVILFALAVLVPWRGAARVRALLKRPALNTTDRLSLYASTTAIQWAAVGVIAWRSYANGLTTHHLAVGLPAPLRITATAAGLTLLLATSQLFGLRRLTRVPPARRSTLHEMAGKIMPQTPVESLAFVALVCTVAVCEEFIYRGFVFAVIQDVTADSAVLAALGSSLLFALAHIYQGRRGVTTTFFVGLLFSAARIWTGSLAPSIAAHLFTDLIWGLAAPRLLRRSAADGSVPPGSSVRPDSGEGG